ncbi:MAG TPA: glycosyltransferase family 4 protein [Candidatus Hydrogenedentes bacterium]|nr:glycosyltransferase family 4 protein [Candidatus Hydrogenedentota bacterium]HOL78335.1 glycosyltransferase family 4 protein [Candidatus Hydrogenedentota bacterium]HPO86304.1 glycosyltransferase family 4 protein [Candidatus Hydrogenedentota bacterium]
MRIAFADLVFAWPPTGGAQADLYHVIAGLQNAGYETKLFAASYDFLWRFGSFEPEALPFPSMRLEFNSKDFVPKEIVGRFRKAIDAWQPDVVFVGFGRTLKPYLLDALSGYPLISRYYMYEHLCLRDFCLFYDGKLCPNDVFHTPEACRLCMWQTWKNETRIGRLTPYSDEYHRARAYAPGYMNFFVSTIKKVRTLIVNNELAQRRAQAVCQDVRIIPGGVELQHYNHVGWARQDDSARKKVILMSGRADDPRKGLYVLLQAAGGLARTRRDFEVWVTFPGRLKTPSWLKNIGFVPHREVSKIYAEADICVVPSVWEEPFGLVALEAMAAGVPVCASRCGGLATIVEHGVTGFLFQPGNSVELALYLNRLLDDAELRHNMGLAGRNRVETQYTWDSIVSKYYVPLMEEFEA